jgi:hypothetical protein
MGTRVTDATVVTTTNGKRAETIFINWFCETEEWHRLLYRESIGLNDNLAMTFEMTVSVGG